MNAPSPLAAALAGQPEAVATLLAAHVDDGHGRCAGCSHLAAGGRGRPVWPCALADAAAGAQRLLGPPPRAVPRAGGEPASITCPRCARTSHHPADAAAGYCGACHDWTA